jgi:hypothetical protein
VTPWGGDGSTSWVSSSSFSVPGSRQSRAGLGAGVYKTVNDLGAVFGVLLLGGLLEGRIVKNALRGLPGHFLPAEVSLKSVTSLKTVEEHALRKGLPAMTSRHSTMRW